jgi:FkbM family methyltransferase
MKLIFDIGYNKGAFAKECFATYPFCVVVGVEPNQWITDFSAQATRSPTGQTHWTCHKEFMQEAIETMIHNRSTGRLKLITAAATSKADGAPINFHMSPMEPGISTASNEFRTKSRFAIGSVRNPFPRSWWDSRTGGIQVPSITLDEIVRQYGTPDLIKIDVEGYEYEVLLGLATKQKTICFEWTEEMPHVLYKGVEHLQSIGYREFGIIGYFVEGQYSETVTFNEQGDPFLVEPDNYYAWEEIEIDKVIQPDRRINYGMLFAR